MAETSDTPEPKKPPKNPGEKADRATVAERVAEILRIRLEGAAFHDCCDYAKEKGWNVSERQVGRYLEQADTLLFEQLDKDREKVIARHLSQRQALFARAVNAADLRTALSVLDSEAKLRGLFPDQVAKNKDADAATKPAPLIIVSGPAVITPPPDEPEESGG